MNIKFLLLSWTILMASSTIGQSILVDTFKTPQIDTASITRWHCQAGPSVLSKENYALIIVNGKKFKNCVFDNLFFDFDTTTISTVQVLKPKEDIIKLYGKAARNGVILITTKNSIKWISAKQILKRISKKVLSSNKMTLIKVANVVFDNDEDVYFQKDLIRNITVSNNTTLYHIDRKFTSLVTITLKTKSGT